MARAVALCRASGAAIGAHPSYPDRDGFGRRRLDLPITELGSSVRAQCAALAFASPAYVKPHGALYHALDEDADLARVFLDAVTAALGTIAVIGRAGGALAAASGARGLRFLREAYADRGTGPDGRLLPRDAPGALLTDPAGAAARALALAPTVDTVCVHADTPGALAIARAVRYSLSPTGQLTPVPPIPQ